MATQQINDTPDFPAQSGDAPQTKTAAKKEAKRLALQAKQAAAAAIAATKQATASSKPKKEKKAPAAVQDFVNTTPEGEKKDMSQPMEDSYNPPAVEAAWYAWWDKQGFFQPEFTKDGQIKPEGSFVIPIPPPNVTGALHNGHGLTNALQDALIRYYRMMGKTVLFNPGFDHAGISTQSVIEKKIWKEEGKTRHDYGREDFLKIVWKWKDQYQGIIANQLKRLGASYDWTRTAFTMDERLSRAVIETFCRLHEDGILYRANRLVNWCVKLNTTLSNIECDPKELAGRTMLSVPGYDAKEKFEFGVLISFAYPIENSDEKIIVATTRIETMVGDTAIAVHPDDDRYKHLHGKFAVHPFLDRRIPIITDPILVDMSFGTGAVKITPAHDPNDYLTGERHKLQFINILNDDGTFNANAGQFAGMKRYHARNAVLAALKEKGLYIGTENNPMTLQLCSKTGDVVEQIMKPQWWVNCKPLADAALKATNAGEITFRPPNAINEWNHWMNNIQDWCVSRQLWWGHRCPAYFVNIKGTDSSERYSDGEYWIVARSKEIAEQKATEKFPGQEFTLEQDPDVLDTWFSAGLWPFSIMGWPEKTEDFQRFYPNSLLETGGDILFFWIARMVMFGIHLTGTVPFHEIYLHGIIRDPHGRKMSKSLGNVINPLDVIDGCTLEALHEQLLQGNLDPREIEKAKAGQKLDFPKGIPQCGTDALRFAFYTQNGAGRDFNLDIGRVEGYRKFCNKIWNAFKFAMLKYEEGWQPTASTAPRSKNITMVERWILSKLNSCCKEVQEAMEDRNFANAANAIYNFWLYELCDVYIEAMKPLADEKAAPEVRRSAQDTLYTCLDSGFSLLHPFMPYVTEELWQRLPRRPDDETISICKAKYPQASTENADDEAEKAFDTVFATTAAARSLAGTYGVRTNLQVYVTCSSPATKEMLASQTDSITTLIKGAKLVQVLESDSKEVPIGCVTDTVGSDIVVHLLVKGLVDLEAEVAKAEKKIGLAQPSIDRLIKQMQEPTYETKIAASVREKNSERLKELQLEVEAYRNIVDQFTKLQSL